MNIGKKSEVVPTSEYTYQCICPSFDHDSGAGANADKIFIETDPLSELVWSPNKGLCVRYADGRDSLEKNYMTWYSEPTKVELNSNKDAVIAKPIDMSEVFCNHGEDDKVSIPFGLVADNKGKMPFDLSHDTKESGDHQVQEMKSGAGPSNASERDDPGSCSRGDVTGHCVAENETSFVDVINAIRKLKRSYADALTCCDHSLEEKNEFREQKTRNIKVKMHYSLENRSKVRSDPGPCRFLIVEQQSTGRSCMSSPPEVLVNSKIGSQEHLLSTSPRIPTSSRCQVYKSKNKCLSFAGENASNRFSCEQDNSNESVESCSRVDLLSAGKSAEPSVIIERKILKPLMHGPPGCSSSRSKSNSFMMWVSNMFKGHPGLKGIKHPIQNEITGSSSFQNLFGFRSPKRKALELSSHADNVSEMPTMLRIEDTKADADSTIDNRAKPTVDNYCKPLIENDANPARRGKDISFSCSSHAVVKDGDMSYRISVGVTSDNGVGKTVSSLQGKGDQSNLDKAAHDSYINKSELCTSVWITRLKPKPLANYSCREDVDKASNSNWQYGLSDNISDVAPIYQEIGNGSETSRHFFKEPICTNFARRLNHLKNIATPESSNIREDLVIKKIESQQYHDDAGGSASDISLTRLRNRLARTDSEIPLADIQNVDFHFKSDTSNTEIIENDNRGLLNNLLTSYTAPDINLHSIPKFIFDAMRKLQIPRADVLKWIQGGKPLSEVEGFLVRVRLASCDGNRCTRYVVAIIDGEQRKLPEGSTLSLGVDVGGAKRIVECQYISNHSFRETEVAAWCSSTLRNGGQPPSAEDLRLKSERKEMLGLRQCM